jgi:hypothetical protein
METAMAVIEQDRDGILSGAADVSLIRDDDEIRLAVAVEIVDGNLPWFSAGRERRTGSVLQGAPAIAKQDRYGIVVKIGSNDVGVAVLVEVGSAESFVGRRPVGKNVPGVRRRPVPSPRRISIWLLPQLSVAASSLPSELKSATTTLCGCG